MQELIAQPFVDAIELLGEPVRYIKAYLASDVDARFNTGDRDVNNAAKDGFRYIEQTLPEGNHALIYESSKRINDSELGWIEVGDCRMTCMPQLLNVKTGDLIIRTYNPHTHAEVVRRTGDALGDRLAHPNVVEVTEIATTGSSTVAPKFFTKGTDWTLSSTGRILWTSGGQSPTVATGYTVEYSFAPTYICLDIGTKRARKDMYGDWLPLRVLLQLKKPSSW